MSNNNFDSNDDICSPILWILCTIAGIALNIFISNDSQERIFVGWLFFGCALLVIAADFGASDGSRMKKKTPRFLVSFFAAMALFLLVWGYLW